MKEDVGVLSGGGTEDTPVAMLSDRTSRLGFVSDKATSSIVGVAALSSIPLTGDIAPVVLVLVLSVVACGSSSSSSNSISTSLTTMMFLFLALGAFTWGNVRADGGIRVIGFGMA